MTFSRIAFALLILIAFAPLFLREQVIGTDSFYYLNLVCGKIDSSLTSMPLEPFLFSLISCNVILIKLILFVLFLASLAGMMALCESFGIKIEENWHFLLILLGLSFAMYHFYQFENDQFAYPLAIWGLAFLVKSKKWLDLTDKNALIGFGLLGFAGLVWGTTAFFSLVAGLFSIYGIVLFLIALIFSNFTLLIYFLPSGYFSVDEAFSYGQIMLLPFFIMFLLLYLHGKRNIHKKLLIALAITVVLTTIKSKFWVLAIPFVAITGYSQFLQLTERDKKAILVFCGIWLAVWIIYSFTAFPTNTNIEVLREAAKIDLNGNEFGLGYALIYYGGKTNSMTGWVEDHNYFKMKGNVLGWKAKKPQESCDISFKKDSSIILYHCD